MKKNDYPLVLFQPNKKSEENVSKVGRKLNNNYEFYPPLSIQYKAPLGIEYKPDQTKPNKTKQDKITYKNLVNGKEIVAHKAPKRKSKESSGRL